MSEREFTCANCHQTFVSGWTEKEARAEAEALWGGVEPDEAVTVCGDCFEEFMHWWNSLTDGQRYEIERERQNQ